MAWLGTSFGVSSNLDGICNLAGAGKVADYFKGDFKPRIPGFMFLIGTITGGYIASTFLSSDNYVIAISDQTVLAISNFGVSDFSGLQPSEIFNWSFLFSTKGAILLCLGGFLIGFGTRYAGGCTSGHSISGLSTLQPKSLIATLGFFIGGLISAHFILPLILTP
ncbi:MAG: YeeE/YedE family protein [Flavobacteriales bacterium]